ncbi:uncharacterized protein EV422DRAFT_538400 [Fimicolochytrium jonesii]|uniref:uncharacterized protein n=1 Tax=Fimicolochytrium jonesii TaxID=1396493 RepID=UPI0022FEEDBC|nr:uncharacterized protein EV422DRAFT_538400 [Fimicolochytrium jonesii]KAI8818383.1 hypothetical protein EV422DRAFT_538400 [Fimicolochytrium jonesii]
MASSLKHAARILLSALDQLDGLGEASKLAHHAHEKAVGISDPVLRPAAPIEDSAMAIDVDLGSRPTGGLTKTTEAEGFSGSWGGVSTGPSPLKRKLDSGFPLPDAKSQRTSASLSSRMQRSLRVHESHPPEESADFSSLEHLHASGSLSDSGVEFRSRRPSRLACSDSHSSFSDGTPGSADMSPGVASPSRPLSRGTSSNDLDASSISDWILCQARRNRVPLEKMQATWELKKKELEYNLGQLVNGVPSDSYQDLKLITTQIIETANWLSGGNHEELGDYVPMWRSTQTNIENVIHFVKVVEDMKSTIATGYQPDGDLPSDLLQAKKEAWGDLLSTDGARWRTMGFPIDELQPLINAAGTWIYGLPWNHLARLDAELQTLQGQTMDEAAHPRLHVLMERVFDGILFARDCAEFVGRPMNKRIQVGALSLVTVFFSFTISFFESKSLTAADAPSTSATTALAPPTTLASAGRGKMGEAHAVQYFGNLVKLLEALEVMTNAGTPLETSAKLCSLGKSKQTRLGHFRRLSAGAPDKSHLGSDSEPQDSGDDWAPTKDLGGGSPQNRGDQAVNHAAGSHQAAVRPRSSPASVRSSHSETNANTHNVLFSTSTEHDPETRSIVENFARVVVEAGLQICEYFAARNHGATRTEGARALVGSTDVRIAGGRGLLVLVTAVRYVRAVTLLAGCDAAEMRRVQVLVDRLPSGSII